MPLGTGVLPLEDAVLSALELHPDYRFLVDLAHLGAEEVDEAPPLANDIA